MKRQTRSKSKPESHGPPTGRLNEALDVIDAGLVEAAKRLVTLSKHEDPRFALAAIKAMIDFAAARASNPWQVPDSLLSRPPAEQLEWALKQRAALDRIVARMQERTN